MYITTHPHGHYGLVAALRTRFALRGHETSPALFLGPRKPLFPHESAKKEFEGATSHTTCGSDPLVVSPQGLSLPEGWATIPGQLSPGHLPWSPWAGKVRSPCRREQAVMLPNLCDARHEEDREEDNGDKDMPRSFRDTEHVRRGNRNEASLGTVTNKQILSITGQGVLKKPCTTKIRFLRPVNQHRGPSHRTISTSLPFNAGSSSSRELLVPQCLCQDTHMAGRWGQHILRCHWHSAEPQL